MNVSLFQAASGMNASARWQEITAENLAASQVPGYKRQSISIEPFATALTSASSAEGAGRTMPNTRIQTDFSPAGLRATSVDTDLAIDGDGFFAVQLPSGDVAYTRDGEFHRTPAGQLVSKQGFPILGDSGPIQLDPNNPELFISSTGEITQGSEAHGKVKVVKFSDPSMLTPIGAGQFTAQNPGLKSEEMGSPSLRQGYLELANTNSVAEMTQMISSMRMFEMNQRIIQSQDERMGRTITELAGNT